MDRALVADLGLGPEIWLFLTLLSMLTVFFKFSRFWSVRNLDLVLLFALAPGLMRLVGSPDRHVWAPFAWLFVGSGLWLVRCLVDLGLTRRPLLEPNLSASGLACASVGLLGLLVAESILLPLDQGVARNPASHDAASRLQNSSKTPPATGHDSPAESIVAEVMSQAPLASALVRGTPQVVVSRILAGLAHLAIVVILYLVGSRIYERPISGLAMAAGYLLAPYTRIAVVDSGQLVPAALVAGAVLGYRRPVVVGILLGLASCVIPIVGGLLPLWAGFYFRRGAWKLLVAAGLTLAICNGVAELWHPFSEWAHALGVRGLADAGLLGFADAPRGGSFWTGIDPVFRLPLLILQGVLILVTAIWPGQKNLGEVIALSGALLVASQFWYLEEGGTLILLYLPLLLMMMFRPNLLSRRPAEPRRPAAASLAAAAVRA
jgi:hypothetical protein